ncbi:XisI protein [Leptolyngbya cf. ectocarpi LEGE 11479]|uniref:XisI protein n=2 Tax=Leptolyngbya ectocarpi TaxID=1202 RepID=A0A928ZVH5_LEPEC|nr:XisI protein [Leptolyngbya cf. ectocarpi LEGE 11479]
MGIATQLLERGVPADDIVLGFQAPSMRHIPSLRLASLTMFPNSSNQPNLIVVKGFPQLLSNRSE